MGDFNRSVHHQWDDLGGSLMGVSGVGPAVVCAGAGRDLEGICEGVSDRLIARRLGRAQSTISREITRNGGRDAYRVRAAQDRAELRVSAPEGVAAGGGSPVARRGRRGVVGVCLQVCKEGLKGKM